MSKRESMTDKLRRMNAERQAAEVKEASTAPAGDDAPGVVEQPENGRKPPNPTAALPAEAVVPSEPKAVYPKEESRISEIRQDEVHPAQGGRGDFLKVTVTMDPDDFEAINAEMVRRKRAKEKGAQLSGCIREAIRFWRAAGMPRQ